MMKSKEAKDLLMNELQKFPNKSSEEIGKIFRLASRQEQKYINLEIYWNSPGYNDLYNKYEDIEGEIGFKFAHCVGIWRTSYFYCTSNMGRILVVDLDSENIRKLFNSSDDAILTFNGKTNAYLNKNNCRLLNIEDGFITGEKIHFNNNNLKVNTTKNIYEFVRDSGWLDNDRSKKLALEIESKIEIHHINNKPNDNRADNLIYLPKSIHSYSH